MVKVKYTGTSDFQIFNTADFEKAEIEDQKKVTFAQGEPTEVSEAAASALLSKGGIFGDFSFESAEEEEKPADSDSDGPPAGVEVDELDTSGEAATTEGTANAEVTASGGGRRTGRGSSTRGSS